MSRHHSTEHTHQGKGAAETGAQDSGTEGKQPGQGSRSGALSSRMMIACVVLMGGAMLPLLWRGQTPGSGVWLLLPMLLCLGAHFLMHRHGHGRGNGKER
ncbi:hypothetical protein [Billgrantia endophytica]|uniref:hypothetical protein n=1 Tax=Billgrantia endophytica TaxID=2033802 RepID=UPI00105647A4|nr:hypothetical protein [Halomonas endophytica]